MNIVLTNRRFDQLLESCATSPRWLQEQEVANIVAEAIRYRDKREYDLIAFCIMPNHVHTVFDHAGVAEQGSVGRLAESTTKPNRQAAGGRDGVSTYTLTPILESLKKYTALQALVAQVPSGNTKATTMLFEIQMNSNERSGVLSIIQ
ncbi:MAG: hypothetical protein O7D34_07770 [Ignavibacteria bacterium]|nr:hypothetical protein [Ignavibacteria bacterium]